MTLAQTNCLPHRKPRNVFATMRDWIAIARQRRALASLSQAQLDDIGISAQQAETEANRPIWDVPAHWRG